MRSKAIAVARAREEVISFIFDKQRKDEATVNCCCIRGIVHEQCEKRLASVRRAHERNTQPKFGELTAAML